MDSLTEVLSGITSDQSLALFWLDIVIKSSALILLALAVTKIIPNLSSARKHYIWAVTFCLLLALPVLSLVLPHWNVPIKFHTDHILPDEITLFSTPDNHSEAASSADSEVSTNDDSEVSINDDSAAATNTDIKDVGIAHKSPDLENINHVRPGNHPSFSVVDSKETSLIYSIYSGITAPGQFITGNIRLLYFLQIVWFFGVMLLALKRIMAYLLIYRVYKNSVELNDLDWISLFTGIKADYNISRPVKLLKSNDINTPMTWGIRKPVIVVPSDMTSWPEEKKRYILIHEFAHIKRFDIAVQFISGLVCMIQWFNPLVWIARNKMANECEHACDDYVLEKCGDPSVYAKLLLDVANNSIKWDYGSSVVISMARKNYLEGRLLQLLDSNAGRSRITPGSAFITMSGISLLAIPLIMLRPVDGNVQMSREADMSFVPELAVVSGPSVTEYEESKENEVIEILPIAGQAEQIQNNDSSIVAALADILYDEDEDVRLQSVEVLGKIGSAVAVNSVVASLRRNDWKDLDEVVDIFSSLNNPTPIQILMDSIRNNNNDIRREAIFTLNNAPNISAMGPFCDYMNDEDSEIREEAAKGLGRIGVPEVLDCLIPHLKDDDHEVRVEVIEAIGRIQDKRAVPALSESLTDKHSDVREEAASALGAIRDPSSVNILSLALHDENSDVREEAAEALGKIRDKSAIEPLTNALKKEEENGVRREIMNAIGNIYSALNSGK